MIQRGRDHDEEGLGDPESETRYHVVDIWTEAGNLESDPLHIAGAQCGSAAVGTNGKSGKFLYYSCNSRLMKGRTTCDASSINAGKLETFVMDRIRENILTEECLGQLVRLANEELGVNRRRAEQKLERLER